MWKKRGTPAHRRLLDALIGGRIAQKLTQAELANILGVPQSFVSKYETGERRLDVIELLKVSQVIGIDAAMLINELSGLIDAAMPKTGRRNKKSAEETTGRRGPRKAKI